MMREEVDVGMPLSTSALAKRRWRKSVNNGFRGRVPEFDRVMADARQGKVDCVIVWKLDHWGRNLDHCLESIQELRSLDVSWIAIAQELGTDVSNPKSPLAFETPSRSCSESSSLRVAIYARVSTTDQNCEMQLRELREYCRRRQWTIAGEYVDTGWSGAKVSRPQLDRVMADARQRRVDCIIVWKLDRWGRSLANCLGSIQELRSLDVRWIAVTQNLDTDASNPMSRLMLTMMAAFAEFEREMILERVRAGLKSYREDYRAGRVGKTRHSKSGRDLPAGRQRRIFSHDKALRLRKEGKSIREIARRLEIGIGTTHRLLSGRF